MMNPISSSKTFIQSSKSKNRILPRLIPAATSTNAPVAFFTSLLNPKANLEQKKEELLEFLAPLQLGALATEEDKSTIEKLARQLERINPTKSPLLSPKLNGQWKLFYTTSDSILGLNRPAFLRPKKIFQTLDNENLKARNDEGPPFFNAVKADLEPENDKKTQVQFTTFYILGFIPVTAPASARGELEITYLDEDLRISRGNKGNLFVLKMQDNNKRP